MKTQKQIEDRIEKMLKAHDEIDDSERKYIIMSKISTLLWVTDEDYEVDTVNVSRMKLEKALKEVEG